MVAVAQAEIEIAGVAFMFRGIEARRGADGRVYVGFPRYAHDGADIPVVEMPADLENAIVREIFAMVK